MASNPLQIRRIDARNDDFTAALEEIRQQLSPSGNVVSPQGQELTKRVFGEPLAPREVVERICSEVQTEGQAAVARYSRELDGYESQSDTLRLDKSQLEQAHAAAAPEFLEAVRRIRDNVYRFQRLKPMTIRQ